MLDIIKLDKITLYDIEPYKGLIVTYSIRMISTNQYYVGYTDNIVSRIFNKFYGHIGSLSNPNNEDYIHLIMRKNPLNDFEFRVEGIHETESEAKCHESQLINTYDSFNNGFNMTNNGHGGTGGRIRVFNSRLKDEKFIKPCELDEYKSKGYKKGSDRVVVSPPENGDYNFLFKRVKRCDLMRYLDKGFTIGSKSLSTTKGNVFVYKEGENPISIPKSDLKLYESKGYIRGFFPNLGTKKYFNPNTGEVRLFKFDENVLNGFILGTCLYGHMYKMTNGTETIKVKYNDKDKFIKLGYKFTN